MEAPPRRPRRTPSGSSTSPTPTPTRVPSSYFRAIEDPSTVLAAALRGDDADAPPPTPPSEFDAFGDPFRRDGSLVEGGASSEKEGGSVRAALEPRASVRARAAVRERVWSDVDPRGVRGRRVGSVFPDDVRVFPRDGVFGARADGGAAAREEGNAGGTRLGSRPRTARACPGGSGVGQGRGDPERGSGEACGGHAAPSPRLHGAQSESL